MGYANTNIHHSIYSPSPGQSVLLPYMANPGTFSTFTLTDQTLLVYPFSLFQPGLAPQSITVHTNTGAGAGAKLYGAIWDDNNGKPGSFIWTLVSTAATAANSDLVVAVATSVDPPWLSAGRYWIGIVQQGAPSPSITLNAAPVTSLLGTCLPFSTSAALAGNVYVGWKATGVGSGLFNGNTLVPSMTQLAAGASGSFLPVFTLNF